MEFYFKLNGYDFKLQFFKDDEFQNEFLTTQQNDAYEVQSSGSMGIDSDAVVTVSMTDDVPSLLFYKFSPNNIERISDIKNEIKIAGIKKAKIKTQY